MFDEEDRAAARRQLVGRRHPCDPAADHDDIDHAVSHDLGDGSEGEELAPAIGIGVGDLLGRHPQRRIRDLVGDRPRLHLAMGRVGDAGEYPPADLDEISERTGLLPPRLLPRLFELELLGSVRRVGGGRFVRFDRPC